MEWVYQKIRANYPGAVFDTSMDHSISGDARVGAGLIHFELQTLRLSFQHHLNSMDISAQKYQV